MDDGDETKEKDEDNNYRDCDEDGFDYRDRRRQIFKVVAIVSTCLAVVLLICVIVLGIFHGKAPICDTGPSVLQLNLEKPEVFDELTLREFNIVKNYLFSDKNSFLKLVPLSEASLNSSYIFMVDLLMPLKHAVLKQIDTGYKQPPRTAKAVIFRGDLVPPRVEEYHVGPLPYPEYARLVTNPSYTTPRIPFYARPMSNIEYKLLYQMLDEITEEVYSILIENFGLSFHNCTKGEDCMIFQDTAPRGYKSGDRKTWFSAFRDIEGYYLHPLGLEIQINHESIDSNDWSLINIVFNGHAFKSVRELLWVYPTGRLGKPKLSPIGYKEHLYSSYVSRGSGRHHIPLRGPEFVEPHGKRFKIEGRHVKYMNWDFHIHLRSSTGLQIFDIRFQDERIAYEISLQDAVVFYSGFGPAQSSTHHFDTSMLMGRLNFELVRGVDCPDTAVFLDAVHMVDSEEPRHYKNVICVFEVNTGRPLRRHYTSDNKGGFRDYGGLVEYYLVVRTITSVWSYDYVFDYIFHMNGAIEVKVTKTGYVLATYAFPQESAYGNRVHEYVAGDAHQHLFHYKVDLDINGRHNRYATLETATKSRPNPWYDNKNTTSIYLRKNVRTREHDLVFLSDDRTVAPRFDIIYNEFATSKFGSPRAYHILNMAETKHILQEAEVANAARWAKYPIAITQFKDTEEMSTSIYAQNDPWNPVVDFDRFLLNNESIVDEDLVAWVTIGAVHIPHTEDVPSSSAPGNEFKFLLLPYNYFTECPSVTSPNVVRIHPKTDSGVHIDTHGMSFKTTCVQDSIGPYDFSGRWDYYNVED